MALAEIVRNNTDDFVIYAADDFNLNKKGGATSPMVAAPTFG